MSKAGFFNTRSESSVKYAEQRKHPKWLDRRVTILSRDKLRCQKCWSGKDDGVPLHVHHLYYVKGRDCWDYPDFALMTLCEECHEEQHECDELDYEPEEWESAMEVAFRILPDHSAIKEVFCLCASYVKGDLKSEEFLDRIPAVFELVRNVRERLANDETLSLRKKQEDAPYKEVEF